MVVMVTICVCIIVCVCRFWISMKISMVVMVMICVWLIVCVCVCMCVHVCACVLCAHTVLLPAVSLTVSTTVVASHSCLICEVQEVFCTVLFYIPICSDSVCSEAGLY